MQLRELCLNWLDIGSGKTLIAAMLANKVLQNDRKNKKVIFIVNAVLLCEQQCSFLKKNCAPFRITFCHGKLGVDFWDKGKWFDVYSTHDILVMTAQVFLDNLHHAYVKLTDIALLVFDECHHTRKSHPYNCIMKEFYFRSQSLDRPHILGLTASPVATGVKKIKNQDKLNKEICKLERNLDSKITRPKNPASVEMTVSRPEEILVHFQPTPPATKARLDTLLARASAMSIAVRKTPSIGHQRTGRKAKPIYSLDSLCYVVRALGRWCAGHFVSLLQTLLLDKRPPLRCPFVDKLQTALAPMTTLPAPTSANQMSSQVIELLRVLRHYRGKCAATGDQFCCIVFVQRRYSGRCLAQLINALYANSQEVCSWVGSVLCCVLRWAVVCTQWPHIVTILPLTSAPHGGRGHDE